MPKHNVQHFKFLNSFQEDAEDSNQRPRVDFSLIDPYVQCNEINSDLSNAPAIVNAINVRDDPDDTIIESFPPWTPSPNLQRLLNEFETKILYDHPNIPCAYC